MLRNLLSSFPGVNHRLLQQRVDKKDILLCLVTSDTGLCGSYNSAVIHMAEEFIRNHGAHTIRLLAIGRKGLNHFKKSGLVIADSYTEIYGRYASAFVDKITQRLIDIFLSGQADEVYMAYTNFVSAARHKPVIEKLLNVEADKGRELEYLIEPDAEGILDKLLPVYVSTKMRTIILSAFTAENSTRVMAMHEATDNAKGLLEDLVLLRNKMRQADITREIIEVISSVDALRG
jgi:F-type H+-transporting ATPase subunit gamma